MIHTFLGPDWRAQVTVIDRSFSHEPPLYVVYVLHAWERPSVSFRGCGNRVYYGIDSSVALSRLVERVPDAVRQMPRGMRRQFGLIG